MDQSMRLKRIEQIRVNHAPMIGQREIEKIQRKLNTLDPPPMPEHLEERVKHIMLGEERRKRMTKTGDSAQRLSAADAGKLALEKTLKS